VNKQASVLGKLLVYMYAIFLIVPMYIIVVTSFKTSGEISVNPLGLPKHLTFSNFTTAFEQARLLKYGLNSVFVTVVSVFFILVVNVICAYGLYRIFNKKLGVMLYSFIMLGMMVPGVGYITTILLYRDLHLYNSLQGLILSNIAGSVPFAIFILTGFLRSVAKELEEAGTIDGCSDFQKLTRIMVPVIIPAIISIGVLNMIFTWNNLFGPLLLIRNKELFTIPVGLLNFKGQYSTDFQLLFASIFIVSTPILLIYFKFQKAIVESLSGSVKG
jgi:raffinose/stachyose/melibiose transport system permease protein